MVSIPKPDPSVGETFAAFPPSVRKKILALRRLIFETADATEGVGPITETLKWGQPSHLIEASRSGTTIRLGWKASAPTQYAMYVHCQTHLVDSFRTLFPRDLTFEDNRAIVFQLDDTLAKEPLSGCIAMALTYHRQKAKSSSKRRRA
jgi:hypothetical protein